MRQLRAILLPCLALAASTPGPARSEAELRAFYVQNCIACHGEDGSATARDGRRLKGRDFTVSRDMERFSDQALARTIRKGLFFGMTMPAYKGELSEEEALILVRDILRKARKGTPILAPNPSLAQTR